MKELSDKYVAQALEGYEQNYESITEAIDQIEKKLSEFLDQRAAMKVGIEEMRGILGLEDEDKVKEAEGTTTTLNLVNDGTAIE